MQCVPCVAGQGLPGRTAKLKVHDTLRLTKRARGSLSPLSRPVAVKAVARARRAFMQTLRTWFEQTTRFVCSCSSSQACGGLMIKLENSSS